MVQILLRWVLNALAILCTAYLLQGVHIASFSTAFVLAVVLGILNALVKPLLIFLTLPLTLISFGLFIFILNALLVLLAGRIVPGFHVDSFGWALLFSIVLSLINSFLLRLTQ